MATSIQNFFYSPITWSTAQGNVNVIHDPVTASRKIGGNLGALEVESINFGSSTSRPYVVEPMVKQSFFREYVFALVAAVETARKLASSSGERRNVASTRGGNIWPFTHLDEAPHFPAELLRESCEIIGW
ncbi:hypothetical protein N9L47_10385 [Rhodobacteraceae bacterium]|nr:hypothetical protein [Paracoccaceae bacterium]